MLEQLPAQMSSPHFIAPNFNKRVFWVDIYNALQCSSGACLKKIALASGTIHYVWLQ